MIDETVSTKDQPGTYDAIETAKPGEPLFPLQGGDPFAPATVLFWVDQARRAGMKEADPRRADKLLRKASSAERVAWAMQEYQRGVPDEAPVEPEQKGHAGAPLDDPHKWRAGLTAGTKHLHEAAANFSDAAEHLPPGEARALQASIDTIRVIAEIYMPKRASYSAQPELPSL